MSAIQEPALVSIKTILFATDLSAASDKAGLYARAMARRFAADVEVAHVFDPSTLTTYEQTALGPTTAEMWQFKRDAIERVRSAIALADIPARIAMREESPSWRGILALAREQGADLIVAGTHSRAGINRFLVGSTAKQLIRHAECPVLTIGPRVPKFGNGPWACKNIVYATDFSAGAAKAATYALSFAQDARAHLYLCHVHNPKDETPAQSALLRHEFEDALSQMIPASAYDWCDLKAVVAEWDAVQSIVELAEKVEADLIVLGARRGSFWLTHIERGVTLDVVAKATCPVMTAC